MSCLRLHRGHHLWNLLQIIQQRFGLGCCICKKRYVHCKVCVRNSFCGISSVSWLLSVVIFCNFICQCFKYEVSVYYKLIGCYCIFLQNPSNSVEKVHVNIWRKSRINVLASKFYVIINHKTSCIVARTTWLPVSRRYRICRFLKHESFARSRSEERPTSDVTPTVRDL